MIPVKCQLQMTIRNVPQRLVGQDSGHVEALGKEHYGHCLLYKQGMRRSRVFSSSAREAPRAAAEMLCNAREHIRGQQVSWLRHPSNAMEEEAFSTDDGTRDAYTGINEQGPDSKPHKYTGICVRLSIIGP